MDYQAALQYLYGLTDYEKERIARYDPATLDLSRVRRVEVENAGDVGSALALALDEDAPRHPPALHVHQPSLWARRGAKEPRGSGSPGQVGPVCVTGSIFVVADAREAWALRTGDAVPETDAPLIVEAV